MNLKQAILCSALFNTLSAYGITYGHLAEAHKTAHRSTVALTTSEGLKSGRSFCSGVLIRTRVVLTAAHCIINADKTLMRPVSAIIVVAGLSVAAAEDTIRLENLTYPPNVNLALNIDARTPEDPYDLALLYLARPVREPFAPITIGDIEELSSQQFAVAGFGQTTPDDRHSTGTLKWARMRGGSAPDQTRWQLSIQDGAICSGDSGGPMFGTSRRGVQLYGINTVGNIFCGTLLPKSEKYFATCISCPDISFWIDNTIAKHGFDD